MGDFGFEIDWEPLCEGNNILLRASRQLADYETEAIRQLLIQAFEAGYDHCREERDKQERDPSHMLHRINPYRDPNWPRVSPEPS